MKQISLPMLSKGVLAILIATSVFTSCKKTEDDKNKNDNSHCQIIRLSEAGEPDLVINYNLDGSIKNISDGDYIKSFDYSGNSTTITKNVAGSLVEKTTVKINDMGLATEANTVFNANGNDWVNYKYNYQGNTLISTYFEDDAGNFDTTWYTWKNGNVNFEYTRADTTELVYHMEEAYRDGDYLKTVQQYLVGYETIRNTNLIKTATTGTKINNYSYSFDTNHKISAITVVDPKTTTVQVVYECK